MGALMTKCMNVTTQKTMNSMIASLTGPDRLRASRNPNRTTDGALPKQDITVVFG